MKEEFQKGLKLDNLSVGKIFGDRELIIFNDSVCMETLVREHNYLDHGKESKISRRHYDLNVDSEGNILEINYNGYNEFPTDEKPHKEFSKMLGKEGL